VGVSTWEFVLKLDADLSFEPDYFANCFAEFDKDPKLGIGGGNICSLVAGALESESKADPKFHVRGAVKIYRRTCWDQIGGIVRGPCWDSIDELHANMLGWTTRTFPGLKVHHHRPAGQAFGKWKDWVKGGRGNYVSSAFYVPQVPSAVSAEAGWICCVWVALWLCFGLSHGNP
jgi:poly-beta-1,6-N-acetyl-D-glucosamine synthase